MKQGKRWHVLTIPPDWPRDLSPPLVLEQADDVYDLAVAVGPSPPVLRVVVRCHRCGKPVANVRDDGRRGTALFRGTLRSADRRQEVARTYGHKVALEDQYLACPEGASAGALPRQLPVWCEHLPHGRVELKKVVAALQSARWGNRVEPIRV